MRASLVLEVARTVLSFEEEKLTLEETLFPFMSRRKPSLRVRFSFSKPPPETEKLPFERKESFQFYQIPKGILIKVDPSTFEGAPRAILLNPPATEAIFFFTSRQRHSSFHLERLYVYLLISHLLYRKRGLLVHASGVTDGEKGFLFVGRGGAGKSTIARLFFREKQGTVLGDDSVAVRREEKKICIYGTPFGNASPFCSPKSTTLSSIFFLAHGEKNQLKPLSSKESLQRLFPEVRLPSRLPAILSSAAESSLDLCTLIPAYELAFVPDERVVSFLKSSLRF